MLFRSFPSAALLHPPLRLFLSYSGESRGVAEGKGRSRRGRGRARGYRCARGRRLTRLFHPIGSARLAAGASGPVGGMVRRLGKAAGAHLPASAPRPSSSHSSMNLDEKGSLSPAHQGSWSASRGRRGMVWAEAVRGGEGRVGPVIVEMCIMLSRGAFCSRDVRLKVPVRVRSARLGARGPGGATRERGDRRGRRPCRGPRRRRLSKSVAKAPIAPGRRRRIVDIPRFFSRPIPRWLDRKSVV